MGGWHGLVLVRRGTSSTAHQTPKNANNQRKHAVVLALDGLPGVIRLEEVTAEQDIRVFNRVSQVLFFKSYLQVPF